MRLLSQNNLQLLWGLLVAVAMALLTVTVFGLFAHEGPWRTVNYLVRKIESTMPSVSPPPAVHSAAAVSSESTTRPVAVAASGGAARSTNAIAPGAAPNAGAALRQVLSQYHDNPNATTTVTLSSSGKISTAHEGALTVQDGMSPEAYKDGAVMSGGKP